MVLSVYYCDKQAIGIFTTGTYTKSVRKIFTLSYHNISYINTDHLY